VVCGGVLWEPYTIVMTTLIADNRAERLASYKEVRRIVEELGSSKLQAEESSVILWASEGLLLATSANDPEAVESRTAFTTLMDDLESHRWAEMVGTPEQPGRATLLRAAFAACSPA